MQDIHAKEIPSMKTLALLVAAAVALPFAASAQSSSTTKPAAKATTKSTKSAPKKKAPISRSAAKAVEEVTPIADDPSVALSEADLAVAQKVFTGKIQCELGADVTVTADDKKPGFFTVSTKGARYRMHPVESRTGAIRLEDANAGAMWLQLGNKSMLMNQKQGIRLADECQSPAQVAFADEMKKNPPKALFDGADAPKK
jgi:Ni/Co efflux regulator RcnB